MKRDVLRSHRRYLAVVAVLILFFFSSDPAMAATLITSNLSSCTSYGHGTLRVEDQSLTIPSASSISSIVLRVASSTGEASARIRIYSDNTNNPGSLLGTFIYSSISGNNVTFTGTATLPAAGKYWLRFSTTASFNPCYNFNPSFSGSLPGWSVGKVRESTDSGVNFTERTDNLSFLFAINGTGGGAAPSASSLSLIGPSTTAIRQATDISASLEIAGTDGKVTFYANGKKIPGCISKQSSALAVTCSWKPSTRGAVAITARVIPTDPEYGASTSAAKNILVGNRSTNR
jgi:hypothetical protein